MLTFKMIFFAFIAHYSLSTTIDTIIPNTQKNLSHLKLNKETLLILPISFLKANQYYKIMTHYIGALGINFKIEIICDDFHPINNSNENMKLNDFSEYDFQTNSNKIPSFCGEDYNKDKILLSLTPYSITYQLKEEKEIEINTIVEIVQSKLNTDVKPLNILTNKHLYRGIFLALFVLPLVIYVFKNEIRKGLIYILGEKIEKKN